MDAFRRVPVTEALERWAFFRPQLERVITRMDVGDTADGVLTSLQLGHMQLWSTAGGQAAVVTEIQTFPKYRLLLIYLVAGENAQDWLATGDQQLAAFAKSEQCKYIEFQGRPGWEKHARRFGYDDKVIRMRKRV